MNTILFRVGITMAALATCAVHSVQAQTVTFATFQQVNLSSTPFTFTNHGTSGTFATTATAIKFNFSGIAGLSTDLTGNQTATITITATTSTPVSGAGTAVSPFNQVIDSGTITITRTTAAAEGTGSKTNLLTVAFSGSPASINGRNGSGNFGGSDPTVTFTSDFIDFSASTARDFAIALTSITPALAKSGSFLRTFAATGSGQFDADPNPTVPGTTAAPELGSLTLLCAALSGGVTICGWRRIRRIKKTVDAPVA
jgi:hypothetical protein